MKTSDSASLTRLELRSSGTSFLMNKAGRGRGTMGLVASGEPNSPQLWQATEGPGGEQRVHELFYVSLGRLARKAVMYVIIEL